MLHSIIYYVFEWCSSVCKWIHGTHSSMGTSSDTRAAILDLILNVGTSKHIRVHKRWYAQRESQGEIFFNPNYSNSNIHHSLNALKVVQYAKIYKYCLKNAQKMCMSPLAPGLLISLDPIHTFSKNRVHTEHFQIVSTRPHEYAVSFWKRQEAGRIAHVQHMRIESPRKTLHYSKREELQFRITSLVLSKCRSKAYENQSKAKQKAKADVIVIEKFRLQASTRIRYGIVFKTKSTLERVFEKLHFRSSFSCGRGLRPC